MTPGVKTSITEPQRQTPVAGEFDVIVCGGGSAGFVAATAAARSGASTLLIERYGILGGTATAGLMVEFGSIHDGAKVIVGGATHEFMHRLDDAGGAILRDYDSHYMTFDPECMIEVSRRMVQEAGAKLLLHALIVGVVKEENRVCGVIVQSKSGRQAYLAKALIDATGDGDVAALAGAEFSLGREGDGKLQPVTLELMLGNVDVTRAPQNCRDVTPAIREAAATGEWPIPTEIIFSWGRVRKVGAPDNPKSAYFFINATNALDVNGIDVRDLTRAEIETRNQVPGLIAFLRRRVPGFEHCYLDRTGTHVGIRETRRITGDYMLTREDVLAARHFPDGVVPACNSIDVHEVRGRNFAHEYLAQGTHYQVPYRCLLPRGIEGLLVAGRCLSADYRALGSARVMVVTMPMGEAAGTAASLAAARKCTTRQVSVADVRDHLRKVGTVIEDN